MKPLARVLVILTSLLLNGCARHFVVERNAGRVDSARSITTSSDELWTVQSEPEANENSNR